MLKNLIYILLIDCTFLTVICFAQQPTQEWVARYNGFIDSNALDLPCAVAVDNSGNVYVTGKSMLVPDNFDILTVKYNSSGVEQWVRRYDGPAGGTDIAWAIALDNFDNIIVAGESQDIGNNNDYIVIKYNSQGVQQWLQRYNGTGNRNDIAFSVALDNNDNIYVTGGSETPIFTDDEDYVTIKYNSSGVMQWLHRYHATPGNFGDRAYCIAVDAFSNVYVTGFVFGSGPYSDYGTLKYNSAGVLQWARIYTSPAGQDEAYSLAVDGSGNVYVTGANRVTGTSNDDYLTVKYDSSGAERWAQRYNGPGNSLDIARDIVLDGAGNVYVTGESRSGSGFSSVDYATIKYNSAGVQQWVQRYNGPANQRDEAYSIALDIFNNVYVTGRSQGSGLNYYDYATVKYNSAGVQQWAQRYHENGTDRASCVVVDTSGNVYVTGDSWGYGTNADYTTIKYSQLMGIQPVSNEIPAAFKLEQNYPNPFNPSTKIKFSIPKKSYVQIKVFDVLGRLKETLVNQELNPAVYEAEIDASNYSSGVYFYQILAGEFTQTKRMILIK